MDPTFTLLPLSMDPSSKAISCPSLSSDDALTTALNQLNALHRTLLNLPATPGQASNTTPPPPTPVNPKRTQQIQKMREQANTAMKKASGNPNQAQGSSFCPSPPGAQSNPIPEQTYKAIQNTHAPIFIYVEPYLLPNFFIQAN